MRPEEPCPKSSSRSKGKDLPSLFPPANFSGGPLFSRMFKIWVTELDCSDRNFIEKGNAVVVLSDRGWREYTSKTQTSLQRAVQTESSERTDPPRGMPQPSAGAKTPPPLGVLTSPSLLLPPHSFLSPAERRCIMTRKCHLRVLSPHHPLPLTPALQREEGKHLSHPYSWNIFKRQENAL